ncbi:hypothetical protein BO94DRAFT_307714 [Aspergillus sclerotioniger CBS 115572]|uniref:Uncharacterized protein n=1 Tax=Aspergillus sclerotioniger CBS 115572 TaxID=1450535 RepID=A0A317V4U9_9EURO|nr:hypothetical protein BO94DRAFT_307714 [Aspergillus sclerotioniger CBS 115572]PWY67220.1 hypothetical protein BO94DRAFT_307714 [Aspergillus sclerotioniger CBS 115572]
MTRPASSQYALIFPRVARSCLSHSSKSIEYLLAYQEQEKEIIQSTSQMLRKRDGHFARR